MTATEFPVSSVKIIAANDHGEAIAIKEDAEIYYMGDIEGDVFINAFNVRLSAGRDDVRAISYFERTYGFEL